MNGKNITDMTTGSPAKHILKFAMPLLLGNLFQQLYNMVDSLVVGNYVGADALAAVGTCGSMNFLFFSLSSGLAIGIGIIVAQFFGAGDEENVRKTIANSIYVLAGAALTVSIIGITFCPAILRLLQTPENIIGDSITYMRTTCAGIIFIAMYNGIASMLRALGDSKTPLYFLMISSVVNVILDLVFVLNLDMGVFGVAFATIIAQAVSAITCIFYAYKKVPYFRLTRQQLRPQPQIIANSFKLGVPIALQNSMIAVSCMVLQGVVNTFGETIMASYTIIGRIEQIVQQPFSSLGTALTTYCGQNMGAGKIDRVKKGFRQATIMVLIFSICMIPIAYIFGEQIIGAFVKEPEVIAIGKLALRINSLCYFGLGMIYVPRAVLNGCGDTGFAMINGFAEVACRVLYSQILTRIPFLGYWGIWITTGATWVTTGIVCIIRYMSGVWCRKSLVERSNALKKS
ncbi:MAG: MATE family efflux transporter [Lachnospiraceae bacterium]|nr:MATE family efflux transporter [Lachnospiraceae bacterium]